MIHEQFTDRTLRCYTDPDVGIYKGYYWSYFHPNKSCDSIVYGPTQIESVVGEDAGIKLFPNPANDVLNIEINPLMNGIIEIIDLTGTKRLSLSVNGRLSIIVGDLEQGLYFVRFYQADTILTRKLYVVR